MAKIAAVIVGTSPPKATCATAGTLPPIKKGTHGANHSLGKWGHRLPWQPGKSNSQHLDLRNCRRSMAFCFPSVEGQRLTQRRSPAQCTSARRVCLSWKLCDQSVPHPWMWPPIHSRHRQWLPDHIETTVFRIDRGRHSPHVDDMRLFRCPMACCLLAVQKKRIRQGLCPGQRASRRIVGTIWAL